MYSNDYLKGIYEQLNAYLATINVLLVKVKNMHYNVEDIEFFDIHEHLDTYYATISSEVDEVAERIRILEGRPDASMKIYLAKSEIKEHESQRFTYLEICKMLVGDFQTIIKLSHAVVKLSDDNHDIGTSDIFTRNIQFYEKAVWMLKALSKNK